MEAVCGLPLTRIRELCRGKQEVQADSETLSFLVRFTNCSARLAESIREKCKVSQLPSDLAARTKVGDVSKTVGILQAWEIKCLANSGQPAGGSDALFLVCCAEKSVHEAHTRAATGKQWHTKVCAQNTPVV